MSRSVTAPRGTASIPTRASGDPRIAMESKSRARRWTVIVLLAVFTAGYWFITREPSIPVGVAIPNLIAGKMTPIEAAGIVKNTNGANEPEVKDGELVVKIPATMFPERRMGQIALAQQYSRADEIVSGKKRAISFLDPTGNRFARADLQKGVVMTR
jgi:hypothetical protein